MDRGQDLNHRLPSMFVEGQSDIEKGPSRLQDRPKLLVAVPRQTRGVVDVGGRQLVDQVAPRDLEMKF